MFIQGYYPKNMKKKLLIYLSVVMVFIAMSSFQLLKTSLKITVIDELGNIVEGASVQLYPSEEDYRNEVNAVSEVSYTDKKGQVKFKELDAKVYYVNASKGDKNNIGAGVQTDKLEEGKLNKVNIVIE
ncbi:carboxypeptidase regulatory-like domain-containing protein [Fulvivirga sp. M361]|nr:carboxypeptidase regulatory-like domain-containing protein [Fulvivirga sp. M361]